MRIFNRKTSARRGGGPSGGQQQQPGDVRRGTSSVLSTDIVISGNIEAVADLHIDGCVRGDIRCRALTQGAGSDLIGKVTAETARLAGSIEGAVRVGQLSVERGARIKGDIEYETITIENGGLIDGLLARIELTGTLPAEIAVERDA